MKNVTKSNDVKKRGWLLTSFLILSFLSVIDFFLDFSNFDIQKYKIAYSIVPSWYVGFEIVLTLLVGVSSLAVWFWKKWGVYLSIFLIIVSYFLFYFLLQPKTIVSETVSVFLKILMFVFYGIWCFVIYRKWKYFE